MKKIILLIILTVAGVCAPAYQGEITFTQKDGSDFSGHLHGDEYFSWIQDRQGHIIVFNKQSNNYELAKLQTIDGNMQLIPSGFKVLDSYGNGIEFVEASSKKINISDLIKIWKEKRENRYLHHN